MASCGLARPSPRACSRRRVGGRPAGGGAGSRPRVRAVPPDRAWTLGPTRGHWRPRRCGVPARGCVGADGEYLHQPARAGTSPHVTSSAVPCPSAWRNWARTTATSTRPCSGRPRWRHASRLLCPSAVPPAGTLPGQWVPVVADRALHDGRCSHRLSMAARRSEGLMAVGEVASCGPSWCQPAGFQFPARRHCHRPTGGEGHRCSERPGAHAPTGGAGRRAEAGPWQWAAGGPVGRGPGRRQGGAANCNAGPRRRAPGRRRARTAGRLPGGCRRGWCRRPRVGARGS